MSEANRVGLYIKKQVDDTSAVQPPTKLEQFRYTGSSVSRETSTEQSQEIRDDGNIANLIVVDVDDSGSINYEYSYQAFNEQYAGVLFSEWVKKPEASVSDVTSVSSGSIDFDKDVGLFAGALIKVTSEDSELSGVYEVSAWDSSTYTATATGIPAKSTLPSQVDVRVVGKVYSSGDVVISQSLKTITLGSGASDALDVTLLAGEVIGINTGTASETGYYRITSVTSNVLVYDHFSPETYFSDVPSGKEYVLLSNVLRNGTTKQSYTILQNYAGQSGSDNKNLFTGCVFNTVSLELTVAGRVTGAFELLALNSSFVNTAYQFEDAPNYDPTNATSDVGNILLGGQTLGSPNYVDRLTFNVNNNLRANKAIGVLGATTIARGSCEVTGEFETFFGNTSIAKDIINNTEKSLFFSIKDPNNAVAVTFDFPRIKYSGGSYSNDGINTDVKLPAGYQAIYHRAFDCQISKQDWAYV